MYHCSAMERETIKLLLSGLVLCAVFGLTSAYAQNVTPPMAQPLWPDGAPGAKSAQPEDVPSIQHYPAPAELASGAAIVVCPGGGYGRLASHEGHDVAVWLNRLGLTAFVLKYRLGPRYHHPVMLWDVQRAIRLVRARASEWKVNPQRIGVMGFSAGGHL